MATATKKAPAGKTLPRLKAQYRAEIVPALTTEFSFSNPMQVPGLTKIVVNMGVGQAAKEGKL
ncbi:MAG: 50S ribosomal protein L5, partial [Aquiluna sp.]|nr:50S ribosomal protein L5 [Aquiluna sp.]